MMYASQLRAVRILIGWRQEDLSKAASVGIATIQRIEQGNGVALANMRTLLRLQRALAKAGVRFIDEDATGGYGVRLIRRRARGNFIIKISGYLHAIFAR